MRIVLVGAPGSGKTTAARLAAQRLDCDHIELDAIHHGRGGRHPSSEAFAEALLARLAAPRWVVDGWHERLVGDLALSRADAVIFLDPPLSTCIRRITRRSLREILLRRPLWNGNRQTWSGAFGGRDSLLGYTLRRHGDLRRRVQQRTRAGELQIVRIRRSSDLAAWLRDLGT